jgi:hypothetical protein
MMARLLLHRIVALAAAYAIALQAVLAGAVPAAPALHDATGVLCAAEPAGGDPAPLRRHDPTCSTCPVLCGGGLALAPSLAVVSPLVVARPADERVTSARQLPPYPRHRLAASRAPPFRA